MRFDSACATERPSDLWINRTEANRVPQMDQLLDRVFESVGSQDGLVQALKDIRTYFGAQQILVQTSVFRRGQSGVNIASDGVPTEALIEYHAHFEAEDPWTLAAARKGILESGLVVRGSDLVPPSELRRTRFFSAFLSKYSVSDLLTAVIDMPSSGGAPPTVLSMHRGCAQPLFSRSDAAALRTLFPHLRRALLLHQRLAPALSLGASLDAAFDRMNLPMLFLDHGACVVRANLAARACVEEARHWRCSTEGRLLRWEQSGAGSWAEVAVDPGQFSTGTTTERLVVAADGEALVETILKAIRPPLLSEVDVAPAALATLRPIDPVRDGLLLQQRFRLTSKELRIAQMLLKGHDAGSIGHAMKLQMSTVRTHIAALLAKCDCTSQLQLQARLRGTGRA